MTFIANVFRNLRTPKHVVRYMSEKSRFKGPFDRQHGKRAKTLEVFVNTLTADDKYSLRNRDNLMEPIHMQLSQKPKTFSNLFLNF